MNLNLTHQYISNVTSNFLRDNFNIAHHHDVREPPGKEHYFLLAAIGIQLKASKIIELGTHKGNSAVALNYGSKFFSNNNSLFTYDIFNCLERGIFDNTNIEYRLENLLEPNLREANREHILSADLIFIDVDPHEGLVEYEMYTWLKNNNYKGIIMFDDIHLGKGHMGTTSDNSMQQFWDKVDDNHKVDITSVGHWSGTGLVSFNLHEHELLLY